METSCMRFKENDLSMSCYMFSWVRLPPIYRTIRLAYRQIAQTFAEFKQTIDVDHKKQHLLTDGGRNIVIVPKLCFMSPYGMYGQTIQQQLHNIP